MSIEAYQLEEGRYPPNYFDYLVNIGAYHGEFIISFSKSNPQTKIIAYEPHIASFQQLAIKTKDISNIYIINKALGDGSYLFLKETEKVDSPMFVKEDTKSYKIRSVKFSDIFSDEEIKLDKKAAVAIDCEGGEKFLLNDEKAENIIRRCEHFSMDVHFARPSGNPNFSGLPEWNSYNSWIYDKFSESHNIVYWKSNRRRGHGFYVLRKKI